METLELRAILAEQLRQADSEFDKLLALLLLAWCVLIATLDELSLWL